MTARLKPSVQARNHTFFSRKLGAADGSSSAGGGFAAGGWRGGTLLRTEEARSRRWHSIKSFRAGVCVRRRPPSINGRALAQQHAQGPSARPVTSGSRTFARRDFWLEHRDRCGWRGGTLLRTEEARSRRWHSIKSFRAGVCVRRQPPSINGRALAQQHAQGPSARPVTSGSRTFARRDFWLEHRDRCGWRGGTLLRTEEARSRRWHSIKSFRAGVCVRRQHGAVGLADTLSG